MGAMGVAGAAVAGHEACDPAAMLWEKWSIGWSCESSKSPSKLSASPSAKLMTWAGCWNKVVAGTSPKAAGMWRYFEVLQVLEVPEEGCNTGVQHGGLYG